jgi:hypothetical protein
MVKQNYFLTGITALRFIVVSLTSAFSALSSKDCDEIPSGRNAGQVA